MARGGTVKQEESGMGAAEPKSSKRRCVQSACVPCRKRKSKCDGGVPVCATCTAVYRTNCFYDADSETRRKPSSSKREVVTAASSATPPDVNDDAEFIVSSIRTLPEQDVLDLIQHIRRDARLDIASLADMWRKPAAQADTAHIEMQSLQGDLSLLLGKPAMTRLGESRHFGHTSGMSLVPEDEIYTQVPIRTGNAAHEAGTWTRLSHDLAFVERLLDLYFRWSHPFYVIFSRECFYKDFRSGREKYCSPLLVNAILAYACHFSDEPAARTDSNNPRTAGDHFFQEARRLFHENESPSLTTVQALCVMAMREPSAGRDSSGFMYMGQCMRMAIELGLHLNNSAAPALQMTRSEMEVRKVTFWGCFTVDTIWSICVGRISQIPRAAISLDKPILDEQPGLSASGGSQPNGSAIPPGTITSRLFLQAFSSLSEIMNDNNYMFFAPKERFTSRRLLEIYSRYQHWYNALPLNLGLDQVSKPQPHIIVLHMLYYTAVLHLFRPLLKVDLIQSDTKPQDACVDAANSVSDLLRLYRTHYDMRACPLVLTHVILSNCIVHLLYAAESKIAHDNLVDGLTALEDMSVCHHFGARGFRIIHALSQQWNIPFPAEVDPSRMLYKGRHIGSPTPPVGPNSAMVVPGAATGMGVGVSYNPANQAPRIERRESLNMFAQPNRASLHNDAQPMSRRDSQPYDSLQQHPPQPSMILPSYPATSGAGQHALSTAHPVPSTSASADTLFWTPVPGMGVPLVPRDYQLSPIDLDNMLGTGNQWDRLSRDGFKMSETWPQDPTQFHAGAPSDVSGAYRDAHIGPSDNHLSHQQPQEFGHGGRATHHIDGTDGINTTMGTDGTAQGFDSNWWSMPGHGGNLH